MPYNQSYQQTTITQLVDTSPEAQVRSLHLQPDDLILLLVTKRPGCGNNLNLGNGRIEQLSADCELIREITDTPTGMKYKIGYINKATGKQATTSGYLRDMHITFASNTDQISPLEIPGEINLTASQVLLELPTQEKQARQQTSWQYYGWIFTDPNGTAPMDATPFRAHKTYILSDALSWISLIGSMSRPRANNRSTNFWAWFGQCLEKLGDMGSVSAPREAYGVESEAIPDTISSQNKESNKYKGWIRTPELEMISRRYIDPTGDSVLLVGKDSTLFAPVYKKDNILLRKKIQLK
ncbi:hypothetical protein [Geofilum rubicundum]|uniref:Uncharacterized protein n=1 Tax=Geofilum rubicundum JCM 15548 TaxID=1236989 RepID=A0A0E9LS20_9BACT|nr:hypothetical protein [Geofilum rubicundum]GAO27660.1 hypothetical protein JCM15548_14501 [Geofilum rubicundum JCM 15548]